jgi:glycerone phosphate O-acyltransferase/fatty acyl-CoA reductase
LFAESIYEERVMDYYEACSLETITNAVQTFETMHILKVDKEFNEKNQ